jgi:hypothetical protein
MTELPVSGRSASVADAEAEYERRRTVVSTFFVMIAVGALVAAWFMARERTMF